MLQQWTHLLLRPYQGQQANTHQEQSSFYQSQSIPVSNGQQRGWLINKDSLLMYGLLVNSCQSTPQKMSFHSWITKKDKECLLIQERRFFWQQECQSKKCYWKYQTIEKKTSQTGFSVKDMMQLLTWSVRKGPQGDCVPESFLHLCRVCTGTWCTQYQSIYCSSIQDSYFAFSCTGNWPWRFINWLLFPYTVHYNPNFNHILVGVNQTK